VIGDGRLLDVVVKPLIGPSFSKSSWFNPRSSSSSTIADKLDDEDEVDKAYSVEDSFSTEGERQLDEKLKLAIQTIMIDTARRGRYMFK
jgi:hypothetical protein